MKNKLFFLFISSLISLNNAKAMEKEVDQFQACPKVIISYIGNFLEGKDFANFFGASKKIRGSLDSLIIKDNQENIKEKIESTSLNKTHSLIEEWKNKKNISYFLKKILPNFEGYESEPKDLKKEREKFKNYIKILNIIASTGDKNVEKNFVNMCRTIEQKYWSNIYINENEEKIINSNLFKFYIKNLSLVSNNYRNILHSYYQTGEHPFKKNVKKAHTLAVPLDLILQWIP